MLSAGPTPRIPLDRWQFTITDETGGKKSWIVGRVPGPAGRGLHGRHPLRDQVVEAGHHLARRLAGHAVRRASRPPADYTMVHGYGGYTTNVPLEDLLDGKAWVAYKFDGERSAPRARRPGPAGRAAPVLLEVGEVGQRHRDAAAGRAGLLGGGRLPHVRRPMARAALSGRLTWRVGHASPRCRDETPSARTLVLDVPDWPGHLPGQHVDVRLTAPDGYSRPAQLLHRLGLAAGRPGRADRSSGSRTARCRRT